MDWTDDLNAVTKKILGKPQYPHDCQKCEYKGSTNKFDIYICPNAVDTNHDSMIARYGKEGHEYASFPRTVFAQAVSDHVIGNVYENNKKVEEPKLPHWMLAVIRIAFGGKE